LTFCQKLTIIVTLGGLEQQAASRPVRPFEGGFQQAREDLMKPKGVIDVSVPVGFFRTITGNIARSGTLMSSAAAHRTALRVLAVIIFLIGKSTLSLAAPCVGGNLQSYIDLEQGGCTSNGLLFNNFTYEPSAEDGATEIPATDVTVGFDFDPNVGSGLIFSANWSVTGQGLDGTIEYDVTPTGKNQKLEDEALLLGGANISCTCSSPPGDGNVSATEGDLETFLNREGSQEADFTTFPLVTSLSIETEISVSAGAFSSASAMSVSNLFSQIYSVPEPSTWAMMLIGFAGLGYAGWRQRSKLRPAAT
jgi:hypothetical protein